MSTYIITPGGASLYLNNKSYNVDSSHPKYNDILQAIRDQDFDSIPEMIDIVAAVNKYANTSGVEVNAETSEVTYNGEPIRGYCVDRILAMMAEGFDIKPMIAYLDNLLKNPSKRAVDELHGFNEYGRMPITPDGYFIAYKRISNWYDTYTKTVLNKPAALLTDEDKGRLPYTTGDVTVELVDGVTTISMPRHRVDDRADNTCSHGLHFCSQEYLKSFDGDRIVVLKINPADVVSIPTDYNNTKGRCSRYQVIDVLSPEDFARAMNTDVLRSAVYETETPVDDAGDFYEGDWDGMSPHDDTDDEDGIVYDFEAGYVSGYADGRKGYDNSLNFAGHGAEGYAEGLKDGKGHKPKKFK